MKSSFAFFLSTTLFFSGCISHQKETRFTIKSISNFIHSAELLLLLDDKELFRGMVSNRPAQKEIIFNHKLNPGKHKISIQTGTPPFVYDFSLITTVKTREILILYDAAPDPGRLTTKQNLLKGQTIHAKSYLRIKADNSATVIYVITNEPN